MNYTAMVCNPDIHVIPLMNSTVSSKEKEKEKEKEKTPWTP